MSLFKKLKYFYLGINPNYDLVAVDDEFVDIITVDSLKKIPNTSRLGLDVGNNVNGPEFMYNDFKNFEPQYSYMFVGIPLSWVENEIRNALSFDPGNTVKMNYHVMMHKKDIMLLKLMGGIE